MNDLEMCRICTSFVNISNSTNLFERNHRSLLTQIKGITGQLLKNERNLPKYICPTCEENLARAHSFRKRCLDSQSYFCSTKYKGNFQRKPIEKIHDKKIDSEEKADNNEEIVLVIKEEANATDSKENNMLVIYAEHNNTMLNTSFRSESRYPSDTTKAPSDVNDIAVTKENQIKNKKLIAKPKRNMSSKFVELNMPALKAKKSVEKIDLICDQCGNHFSCRHHFQTHLRRHTNDKPFKCEICPDKFYTHSELKRHMRRHTGEKPFACKHCMRRFTDYSTRIKHERIHTNERPYACLQCGKAFTTSYVLKNHMLIHTGERSFKCLLCDKAFQRQTHLTVHYRSIMHKQMLEKQEQQQETSITLVPESTEIISDNNFDRDQ